MASPPTSSIACCLIPTRRWQRFLILAFTLSTIFLWDFRLMQKKHSHTLGPNDLERGYPLLWKHVHTVETSGGVWYIPRQWLPADYPEPTNIVDAARIAFQAASSSSRFIQHSSIPLILHQTWKNSRADTWPETTCASVEKWLGHAVSDGPDAIAYFLWEDDGVLRLLKEFDPDFVDRFNAFPANVERADVFRVLVAKWIGGIYADIDTEPLQPPRTWIKPSDLEPWSDPVTNSNYSVEGFNESTTSDSIPSTAATTGPVGIMLGIEADCNPDSDQYWRMGYSYPVQLTQWALASAPEHPLLCRFMENLQRRLDDVASRTGGDLRAFNAVQELRSLGPLILTGPAAITIAVRDWLSENVGLRWNALTGLKDGGRTKVIADVMILPITGFSPGRGRYGNMGSRPITDPAARLWHRAQGSWRSFDFKVEYGKFCRTFFGLCREWSVVRDQH